MAETQPEAASTSALPKPSYYYPTDDDSEYIPVPANDNPDDEDYVCRGVPVFEPTMDEFVDFYDYVQKIDRYGMKAGIVKVIPPVEWLETLPEYNASNLDKIKIRQPIAQHMLGRSGLYKQTNVVKRNVMGIDQWASLAGCGHDVKLQFPTPTPHQPDDVLSDSSRFTRGRGSSSKLKDPPRRKRRRTTADNSQLLDEVKTEDASFAKDEPSDERMIDFASQTQPPTPSHPLNDNTSHSQSSLPSAELQSKLSTQSAQGEGSAAPQKPPPARVGSEISESTAKPSAKKRREELANEFYEGLNIHDVWLPDDAKHEDYDVKGCKQLEKQYWRTLGLGDNEISWYGADLSGSLFNDKTKSWNVANLPSYLTEILKEAGVGAQLPGVNTPYLYFGAWRATFAWHVEDMDLYSINYIHFGAPKFWYTIPQKQKWKFERLMAGLFPGESKQCPEWLRHKSYLASPHVLASQNIKPSVLVQKQNEFVITFPHGYHSGFNMGFNCAESVNFATEGWTKYGRKARACTCVGDSVKIDVDQLLERIEYRKREMEAEKKGVVMKMSLDEYLQSKRVKETADEQISHIKILDYLVPTFAPPHDQQIAWMKWGATQPIEVQHVIIQVPWMQECVKNTLKSTNEKKDQAQKQAQTKKQEEVAQEETNSQQQQQQTNPNINHSFAQSSDTSLMPSYNSSLPSYQAHQTHQGLPNHYNHISSLATSQQAQQHSTATQAQVAPAQAPSSAHPLAQSHLAASQTHSSHLPGGI
ncbi:hypothetical protein E3P86_00102 [Wallemia ichthyophaga]|uniref:Uncharacterized protein n=1 Tax=Wallemia ichthyophaga TaxID=245174 RepID=A0A4T0JJ65_WALIC|nr:hypothetical protein E3P86_00102 [Wallemia ichthyophaga]